MRLWPTRATHAKEHQGAIRKGDVIIEEIDDRGQLSACYETLRKTYENAHVPLQIALFSRLLLTFWYLRG
jgi:hypothetical protein